MLCKKNNAVLILNNATKLYSSSLLLISSVLVPEQDRSKLAARHLETLVDIGPKPDELQKMRQYRGEMRDLVEAEQFFLTCANVLRLPNKLNSFLFTIQFEELASGCRAKVGVITRASAQAKGSENLMKVLESVLAVGNAMNAGTYNESSGFTLDSLLKLTQVKGNDKKTTVRGSLEGLLYGNVFVN